MGNNKDINADLGTQTIEGTSPPTAVEAEIVMPDGSAHPLPTADDLDAQLAELMAEPITETPEEPTVFAMPSASDESEDLDAQLAALMAEKDDPQYTQEELDAVNAKIDAILDGTATPDDLPKQDEPIILSEPTGVVEEPIILGEQPNEAPTAAEEEQPVTQSVSEEQPEPVAEPTPVQEQPAAYAENTAAEQPAPAANNAGADEARAMLEQAMLLMEQAQAAQQQAQAQMQAAQQQQQQLQQQQPAPAPQRDDSASQAIIQQAQMMLQQAQQAQLQAQQAAQTAQLQAQAVQSAAHTVPTGVIPDPYATREVDRLKNELDGMRDLVNKLTFTISQIPGGAQQMAQMPLFYAQQQQQRRDGEGEQFRKLETELEKMRREIFEKELRDREKELERKQKEAENTVKDIRPEMVQMSDSRDLAPMGGMGAQNAPVGGEYIPLANGVYYSIKDKQVYVMTPASNAAAASPTIEPKRTAARPAPKRRAAPPPHRRPGGLHHRRPAPRRPSRPHR